MLVFIENLVNLENPVSDNNKQKPTTI